ncbi:HU family DNA-binding protein [Pedobacter sp. GSP4]|uniref:HU family DNA-binding protein n=1 Tax=Pedobacter sp. GSP4 TaxID=3453716 RepID=UPI003EEB9725
MTKHDLISKVSAKTGLEYQQVSVIVEALFSSVRDAVILGHSAAFREFGTFSSKIRPAKYGRNP